MKWFLSVACGFLGLVAAVSAEEATVLGKQLKTGEVEQRRSAAKSLFEMGSEARPALPDLTAALKDKDLFVRRFSAQALGEIGPDAKSSVPALKSSLSDSKKEVVQAAATALGKIGADGITVLTSVVKDGKQDKDVRKSAIMALGETGANARDAVPALLNVLQNKADGSKNGKKNPAPPGAADLRVEAAVALGDIGPDAKDAVSALQDLAGAKGKSPLKTAAQDALKKITGKGGKKK